MDKFNIPLDLKAQIKKAVDADDTCLIQKMGDWYERIYPITTGAYDMTYRGMTYASHLPIEDKIAVVYKGNLIALFAGSVEL